MWKVALSVVYLGDTMVAWTDVWMDALWGHAKVGMMVVWTVDA